MAHPKIIYKDIAVGGAESTAPSMTDLQPFCGYDSFLLEENQPPQVATLEHDYWVLGKAFRFFPDQPTGKTWGLWSKSMAGADGRFTTPPVLVLAFDQLFSSVGVSLNFDPYGPTWCTDLNITWSRDNTTLASEDFAPNAQTFSCIHEVRNFNKITIRFRAMSAPWRYLKLQSLIYGITRTFARDEFFSMSLLQEASPISEEVAGGALDFSLRNKSAIPFLFQRKQPLEVRDGDELLGVYYVSTAKRTGANAYDITTTDLVGLLDDASKHKGGVYINTLSENLVAEILAGFAYELDLRLKGIRLSGWLPLDARRANLAQVAFALGAVVDTARSRVIRIFPAPTAVSVDITSSDRAYEDCEIDMAGLVTAVRVTEHRFSPGSETQELYKDALSGNAEITFSEPMHSLTIAGGSIVAQGHNYAVIRGTGATVTLTGSKYNHSTRTVEVVNPVVGAGDIENVVEVTDATLVGPSNSGAVAQRVYSHYQRRETVKKKIILGTERPGDKVRVETDFDGVREGTIVSLSIVPGEVTAADTTILCDEEAAT